MEHLNALRLSLSHERVRLANAKSAFEREFRAVRVAGYEKEIAGELKFLGITEQPDMSDDELLAALASDPTTSRAWRAAQTAKDKSEPIPSIHPLMNAGISYRFNGAAPYLNDATSLARIGMR